MPGLAYPFGNSVQGVLSNKTTKEALSTRIQNILLTPKGSIVYNPKYGSEVPKLVFDLIDDATINSLYFYVKADIEEQEPEATINSINIRTEAKKIVVRIGYFEASDQKQEQQQAQITFSRNG